MNYALQAENDKQADWETDKHTLAEMIEQWGFDSIRDAINQMRPDANTFAFGYDDNSHLIHHRDEEF